MGYSPWGCKESDMTERLTHIKSPGLVLCQRWELQLGETHALRQWFSNFVLHSSYLESFFFFLIFNLV